MDRDVFPFPCYLLFDFLAVSMVVVIGVATMWLQCVTGVHDAVRVDNLADYFKWQARYTACTDGRLRLSLK